MPRVDFKNVTVQNYGFPQACVTCGNDEDHQLVGKVLEDRDWKRMGCLVLLLPFGPVGWAIGGLIAYLTSNKGKIRIRVPVCKLCNTGSSHLGWRLGGFFFLSCLLVGIEVATIAPPEGLMAGLGALLFLYGLFEHFWLRPQFQVNLVKVHDDGVTLDLPYEDYPALYQRHVDNAVLYGSSDRVGAQANLGEE